MNVLGVSGRRRQDFACVMVADGKVTAAVEQKKVMAQPAGRECLRIAGLSPSQVDVVAVARPVEEHALRDLRESFPRAQVRLFDHHLAHAASAFYASGYSAASVLTMDTGNDLVSSQLTEAPDLHPVRQMLYPDSVGELYSRVTEFLGMERRADEHKVQWMSAEGDDRFTPVFEAILGEPWHPIDRRFVQADRISGSRFGAKFYEALEIAEDGELPEKLRVHVAAGLQRAVERYALQMVPPGERICLAGGLFFNALLVRAFETSGRWNEVFVQPAAGNSGTAIGAAYLASEDARHPMTSLALGPEFPPEEIKQVLENCKLRFRYLLSTEELMSSALSLLQENKIVAWMQGRMEFGPRALGNRSILASPLDPFSSENLNVYIKHRERFRKFAAAVPAEVCSQFFDVGPNARFLATVGKVRPEARDRFAGAVLGGDWIRVHAVDRADNPLFHRLLTRFGESSGVPVLYNTSFNLFGDPLVASPRDAVRSFYSSGIDAMVAGNFLLEK